MSGLARKWTALMLAAVLASWALGERSSFAETKVTDVKVTTDLRRLIVRCDGEIDSHHLFSMEGPSRLVIEIPGAALGEVERLVRASETGGLEIRVGVGASGARVVADFGDSRLPEHKIMKIGNCLLVMLGEWSPQKGREWSASAGAPGSPRPPSPRPRARPHRPPAEDPATDLGDLVIKSADVVNGMIVLKVTQRQNPSATYHIRLGVDFDRLGFSAASIQPVSDSSSARSPASEHKPEKSARISGPAGVGPRRLPLPRGGAGTRGPDEGRDGAASLVFQSHARPAEGLNAVRDRYREAVAVRRGERDGEPTGPAKDRRGGRSPLEPE